MLVKDFCDLIDAIAPFDTAQSYDNSGLLVGNPQDPVTGVMLALDVTSEVIHEMKALGANLLITHHPLMFSPIQRVLDSDYEGHLLLELARARISLIAAHTNWDKAQGGTNDTLISLLGLKLIAGEGFIRVGELSETQSAAAFQDAAIRVLKAPVVLMGDENKPIVRVGLCTGAGSDEWRSALHLGVDAFLTGEVKHHHALEAICCGLVIYAAGHLATEEPGMDALGASLQMALNKVKCKVAIYRAKSYSFSVR